VGSNIGNWVVCLSSPRKYLPLVHVDDVGAAILQLLQHPETAGEVFNLSHPGTLRVRDYVRKCVRVRPEKLRIIYLPYGLARLLSFGVNILGKLTGRAVNVDRRRLLSSYRSARAGSNRLQWRTGWQPQGDVLQRALQPADPAPVEGSAELDHMAVSQA
jgi:nucleoside-diphosphate-sugar epimerase